MAKTSSIYSRPRQIMAQKLRLARNDVGLTQLAVANLLNTSQSYVSKVELGQCRVDAIQLASLAKIYRKQIQHFLS
jgi:transcriptional regulator with XRE-family HTH domain